MQENGRREKERRLFQLRSGREKESRIADINPERSDESEIAFNGMKAAPFGNLGTVTVEKGGTLTRLAEPGDDGCSGALREEGAAQ